MAAVEKYWRDTLVRAQASRCLPPTVAAIYASPELGTWIKRYHGGMSAGFLAAIACWESSGKMSSAGDPSIGEVGYFQIGTSVPGKFGLPAGARFDPETNVFLGCLDYQRRAAAFHRDFPSLVELGTDDSWKLARLGFQIGMGGTKRLITLANPTRGRVYEAIVAYVDRVGGVQFGGSSASKIWYRVHIVETIWQRGLAVAAARSGWPTIIPAPAGVTYTVDQSIRPFFRRPQERASPVVWVLLGLGAVGLGVYAWLRYR